jgi:hypothetical protein
MWAWCVGCNPPFVFCGIRLIGLPVAACSIGKKPLVRIVPFLKVVLFDKIVFRGVFGFLGLDCLRGERWVGVGEWAMLVPELHWKFTNTSGTI